MPTSGVGSGVVRTRQKRSVIQERDGGVRRPFRPLLTPAVGCRQAASLPFRQASPAEPAPALRRRLRGASAASARLSQKRKIEVVMNVMCVMRVAERRLVQV